jgi:predicted nucleotidyltransferase
MRPVAPINLESASDPILARFRSELANLYGARLGRVVLFGSRARGRARADSDYDVAIFLDPSEGLWRESGRLAEIETDILYDTGAVVNALPFPIHAYSERTPLMHELRRDGIEL